MVKVIMGVKGSGKTKLLIELVEKALEESQGDVVVIEKERSLTYDIPHQARLIVAANYDFGSTEFMKGFISAMHASNYDLVHDQGHAEGFTDDVLGQVVIGGAQAPGGDDEVGPVPGGLHSLPQPGGVVPHHALPIDADAQAPQCGAQLPGVGIHDVPQQELRAHAEDLCLPLFSFHA